MKNRSTTAGVTDEAPLNKISSNLVLSSRSFWRGHSLIAKNRCRMEFDNRPTLTIGKEYRVKEFSAVEIMVMDDEKTPHWFALRESDEGSWQKFFDCVQRVAKKNGR